MEFVTNAWYVAAWADELGRELLGRSLLGEPVVFYRKEDGAVAAISGICPTGSRPWPRAAGIGYSRFQPPERRTT